MTARARGQARNNVARAEVCRERAEREAWGARWRDFSVVSATGRCARQGSACRIGLGWPSLRREARILAPVSRPLRCLGDEADIVLAIVLCLGARLPTDLQGLLQRDLGDVAGVPFGFTDAAV